MKFCPSAVIAFLLLLLVASISGASEDWRLTSYDKVEALFIAFNQKEAELLKQYEPRIAEFYAVFGPYQEAERKMQRYEFLKQLKQNPETINWTSIWSWARGWNTKEQEKLAAEDPAYRVLREEFFAKKEALKRAKDLTRIRNKEYEQHAEVFHKLEEILLNDLQAVQAEVDKRMSNRLLEPSR
jgi:hypothetical protein